MSSILVLCAGLLMPAASALPADNVPVVAMLDAGERLDWWNAFRQSMRERGYVDGKNVVFEPKFAKGHYDQLPALAQEFVRQKVSVIVTAGGVAALAAKRATDSIPIVMTTGGDPITLGLVDSLARPGGNVTGNVSIPADIAGKRVEMIRELLPKMTRMAVLWQRDNIANVTTMRELQIAIGSSGIVLQNLGFKSVSEIPEKFAAAAKEHADAVVVVLSPVTYAERGNIAQLALKYRIPGVYGTAEMVDAGGLLSYAPSYSDFFRKAAVYVDKILKGAKPASLPMEQPTRFELIVNKRTAKAIGLQIPASLLLRADRVIE